MILPQHGLLGRASGNYFLVGIAGDSNAAGRASTAGVTTLPGTCFEFNGTALVELTTGEISTAINGSFAKQFAFDHHARTGQAVVFVCGGVPSATFSIGVNTNNWMPSPDGVNYDTFVSKMDNALIFLGKTNPDAILWSLGVNDINGANTAAAIDVAIDSLMDRITAKYPPTQNLWIQIGRNVAAFDSQKFYDCRNFLINRIEEHPTHAMCCNALTFTFTTGYEADAIHYNSTSHAWYGSACDRYLALNSIPNKWARGAMASLYVSVSSAVQTAIVDLVTTLYANADYFTTEACLIYTSSANVYNSQIDLAFMSAAQPVGATYLDSVGFRLDGVDDYIATSIDPSYFKRASATDVIHMSKIFVNRDLATVAASLFGGNLGLLVVLLQQSGSGALIYRLNDNTTSNTTANATITKFRDDHFYSMARSGTSKSVLEDLTLVVPAVTVAQTGVPSFHMPDGALNGASGFLDCDLQARYSGKFTTLDLTALQAKIQAVIDAY